MRRWFGAVDADRVEQGLVRRQVGQRPSRPGRADARPLHHGLIDDFRVTEADVDDQLVLPQVAVAAGVVLVELRLPADRGLDARADGEQIRVLAHDV